MISTTDPTDFTTWNPKERATLVFVVRDGQILLIEKKRGLGAGKINGPGGRLDPGETPEQCAAREIEEELGITPIGLQQSGELRFRFAGSGKLAGHSLHCYVYRADDYAGELIETDEAKPCWTPIDKIPFERMWADDVFWLPSLIEGKSFTGDFVFDDDKMIWKELNIDA